jgi:hypothetical protein
VAYTLQDHPPSAGFQYAWASILSLKWVAFGWTAENTYTLTKMVVCMKKVGNPVFDMYMKIYSISGAYPYAELGSATNVVNASTLTTSFNTYPAYFFDGISIVSGTKYFIVQTAYTYDGSNYVYTQGDAAYWRWSNCNSKSETGTLGSWTGYQSYGPNISAYSGAPQRTNFPIPTYNPSP